MALSPEKRKEILRKDPRAIWSLLSPSVQARLQNNPDFTTALRNLPPTQFEQCLRPDYLAHLTQVNPAKQQTLPLAEPETPRTLENKIDKYTLISELGRGAMGVVYLAQDPDREQKYALKVSLATDKTSLDQFRREARNMAQLQHPYLLEVYDVREHNGKPFFVMPFIEGSRTLEKIIKELPTKQNRYQEAARLIKEIAEGLAHAHEKGIIHRDLKPANVLTITTKEQGKETTHPKLIDFGLSKALDIKKGATQEGDIIGTPTYMSPEQALGLNSEVDPQSDVYAAGVILYQMLTDQLPFIASNVYTLFSIIGDKNTHARSPCSINPHVPKDLDTICMKALQKDKTKRYASANDFAEDLENYLTGEPINARPETRQEKITRAIRKHPAFYAATCAITTLTLALALATGYKQQQTRAEIEKLTEQSKIAIDHKDYKNARDALAHILALQKDNAYARSTKSLVDSQEKEQAERERKEEAANNRYKINKENAYKCIQKEDWAGAKENLAACRASLPEDLNSEEKAEFAKLERIILSPRTIRIETSDLSDLTIESYANGRFERVYSGTRQRKHTKPLEPGNYRVTCTQEGVAPVVQNVTLERLASPDAPVDDLSLKLPRIKPVPGFTFIPQGTIVVGYGKNAKKIDVEDFYIMTTNVTRAEYKEFLASKGRSINDQDTDYTPNFKNYRGGSTLYTDFVTDAYARKASITDDHAITSIDHIKVMDELADWYSQKLELPKKTVRLPFPEELTRAMGKGTGLPNSFNNDAEVLDYLPLNRFTNTKPFGEFIRAESKAKTTYFGVQGIGETLSNLAQDAGGFSDVGWNYTLRENLGRASVEHVERRDILRPDDRTPTRAIRLVIPKKYLQYLDPR